ncbi:fumarylacetoacetate hydrolase family protein [Rhizohabitans arisaemae]|uniref:fumarylacetoacetate hydrolase family protein n=1 Tax=Rhizohabitans arisaemae TaxID=2720610 RepID=UPI0024B104E2|nr:fumarylacetoacetate hydrolase family protein [Rhizohabitans arisaemae]
MHLVHGFPADGPARWAVRDGDGDRLLPAEFSLGAALAADLDHFRRALEAVGRPGRLSRLRAPVDPWTEVWAAGVTYRISREARTEESRDPDIYQRVYDAPRPELFFKSLGWRVRGPGQAVTVRPDSDWNVPEPELALVVCASGEIAGYTVCDDVSSRSIEGENPLYLPQAKMYFGATALGPGIRPAWEVPDPYDLGIRMAVSRDSRQEWAGSTGTSRLHRRLDDLVAHLLRADRYPHGVILSTGTCLVPGGDFTLLPGDEVRIEIDEIGELVTPVRRIDQVEP